MISGSRKFVLIGLFTLVLIVAVNAVWWVNQSRTESLLEQQLTRRLTTITSHSSRNISEAILYGLLEGDIDAFIELSGYLENIRQTDSLAEIFLIDESYRYIATTLIEPDSSYFLADLNGKIIDSLFSSNSTIAENILLSPTYQSGDIYLKSAFGSISDRTGRVIAVLGVEASVGYYDVIADLKENLYLSTLISLGGGFLAGLLLILLQLRITRVEEAAFMNQTQAFLGRMVAVVSHEIKNPLAIIRGSAERLLKKNQTEESRFIIEEADRLNQIVTGYLDFAKGGKSLLTTDQQVGFILSELLLQVKRELQLQLKPEQIAWIDWPEAEDKEITGYRNSLKQVLNNLLLNAAQASLANKLPIKLGVKTTRTDKSITIEIIDRAGGLSNKELKNAFTPFYTTKQHGSGLGLYLSHQIIDEMNGQLELINFKSGLIARITLPIVDKADD